MNSRFMENQKAVIKNERVDWNSLLLLLLLTVPTAIMVVVLFLWPDVLWIAEIPHTAVGILGSFVVTLLSVFIIARYRQQPGILYISAGLMAMGIIEGFYAISPPWSTEFVWLHSLAAIVGGVFFVLYALSQMTRLSIPSIQPTAKAVGWLLGSTAVAVFLLGTLSIVFSDALPVMVQKDQLTPVAWAINAVPITLFFFAGFSVFRQYRRTGARELFLFSAMLILLFQATEIFYFATMWGIIWWLWQALRLIVYLTVFGYVLKEYIQTSDSLVIEIDERKKIEKSLRKADEDWRDSFNSLDEVMFIIDRDYNVENVNNSALSLLGRSKEEVIGQKCFQVVHGESQPADYCPFNQTLKKKRVASVNRYDNLFDRHFSIKSAPIFDESGEVIKCVYLMRDVTKEVKAEEKEKGLQQELNLTSRLASIGELAAGIAHEINNPLTGVIGFAQMLVKTDIPEEIKEAVEVIHDGAQRTAGIVEKLLTFARHNRPDKEYVDINSIITSTMEIRSYEMRTNNIEINSKLNPDLPRTMANIGQLQQVFLNIIINAEQAMTRTNQGGILDIETQHLNGNIRVSITDNGPGIARENIGKLFDPFFTTKGEDGGTGLGLSISYGIINEHSGKIRARSTPGKGATFIVDLPIIAENKQPDKTQPSDIEDEPKELGGANIMVIDDEPNICRVLDRLLSREGYYVETTSDAKLALEKLNNTNYDLILLDIKMPGMNGIEFYKRIKQINPSLQQKVVCITGDVISTQNKAFLDKARIPCITKPFTVDDLIHQVKSGLGG